MPFPRTTPTNTNINNFLVFAALSVISLFRSTPYHPRLPTMRGGAGPPRPPPLTTSTKSPRPSDAPRTMAFSTPESLSDWLRPRLPSDSFASWGVKPGTKTVHNLWFELSQGETSLHHPHEDESRHQLLLRTVHVATVRIRNAAGAFLVESHQLLSDGTVRHRRRPLSEKMKPGESVEVAAARAVLEELGPRDVRILPGTYVMRVEERASASYPGLPARYILHSVDAEVDGLPEEGEFSTEEVGEGSDERETTGKMIFVKRHFWRWVFGGGGGGCDDDDGSSDDYCSSSLPSA